MSKNIFSVALCVLLLALSVPVEAQQAKKVPRIGYLGLIETPIDDNAFRKGLQDHGYIEGQNIKVEYRYARGKVDRVPDLAVELVRLNVDVIVAAGTPSIDSAKEATTTIPIVFPVTPDPVRSGYVGSFARPGTNLTGFSTLNPVVGGKRLELLKEVMPGISRVVVLWNPTNSGSKINLTETESAAKGLGLQLQITEVRAPGDFEAAFRAAARENIRAFTVMPDTMLATNQTRIHELAAKNRMAGIFNSINYV